MRKFIFPAIIMMAFSALAQQPFCFTTERQNAWFELHPELKSNFEKLQDEAAAIDRVMFKKGYQQQTIMAGKSSASSTYTIPVVFHILHTGGAENISDDQVRDALDILTRDFCTMNTDTADVVADFKNKIGNAQIAFALATKDPSGNCTNGIVRHYDASTDWDYKFSNYKHSWPRQNYLNIYVVRTIGSGAAGYTYLPGSGVHPSMDAIVILSSYVGSIGTGHPGRSRALTHEVGHWLNLPHTWGGTNQPGVSCGDDGVSDTPVTKGFTSCNLNKAAVCNPAITENMQNYMDYAYCQRMFTNGQALRMQNAINSPVASRNNLSTPANLALTGVSNPLANCVPKLDISVAGNFTVCAGKSLPLKSFTSNAYPSSYSWTASNGAQVISTSAANTDVNFVNPGTTTVTCYVENGFGNAASSIVVTVRDAAPEIGSGYSEGFEGSSQALPQYWSSSNTTSAGWKSNMISASEGINSMYVPGETMPADAEAILETPSYDFKNNPGARFTFKYAYRKATTENKDLFMVQASKDCGGTWTNVYVPPNSLLAQNSGGVSSEVFTPYYNHWKLYDQLIDHPLFYPFSLESNVRFRFYFKSDVDGAGYGNRFFLDEVNLDVPVGINELSRSIGLTVYPNPASEAVKIDFTLSDESIVRYQVLAVTGATVFDSGPAKYSPGNHSLVFNQDRQLTAGIYFISFELNGTTMSRKLIIR